MKNLALVLALVLISLPAMGQDKKPVKKPSGEAVKKVASQPDLEALGAKLKVAVAAGKLTEKEAIAIYEKAEAGQGKSKEGAKPKAIVKPAVKPGAKPVVKPGAKQVAKPVAKPIKVDLAEAYEKVAREVRAAVKAGKITEEQAKQKLATFKKQLGAKVPAKGGVKKPAAAGSDLLELFQLVEKGELTAEEAIKKYKAARAKKEFPGKKSLPEKK